MAHAVTLIPGDDSGPATAAAITRVIAAAGVAVDWDTHPLSASGAISADVVASARQTGRVLMGFHRGHRHLGVTPALVQLRRELSLFASHRPVRSFAGIPTRYRDVDLLVIRETTEDVYARIEHESIEGVYESLKVTTRGACERIARHAFETARRLGRRRVTTVHKANIMKLSDGLFLETARRVATEFPDIEHDDCIVDALCMKLVANPHAFDVLLAGNLFGDIVGSLTAGLVGGTSNCPSINVGDDVVVYASSHRDQEGEHANPLTLLHAARMLVRAMGEDAAADRIRAAMERALMDGIAPRSLGGSATCDQMANAVIERIRPGAHAAT